MKSPLGCGADRVVPLAVKRMPLEPDGRHLHVGDGHAAGIAALIDLRPNAQTGAAVRGTDQAHVRARFTSGVPRQFIAM